MKVAMIAGSNRRNASSTKLCRYIGKLLEEQGADVAFYDLYESPLPFYDPDLVYANEDLDRLKRTVMESDAVVLATPEYHGTLSGVLKNALDFLGKDHFGGKVVLSVSSSGGAVAVSSLTHLQTVVRNLHGINCPEWVSIGGETRRFDENGEPEDVKTRQRIDKALNYFMRMIHSFRK